MNKFRVERMNALNEATGKWEPRVEYVEAEDIRTGQSPSKNGYYMELRIGYKIVAAYQPGQWSSVRVVEP